MARKTQEESQKTRDSILNAAETVFLRKGVSHASMADIAGEAGISRGAIYGHYKNKTELGMAMCYRALGSPDEWVDPLAEGESPLQKLRSQFLAHMKTYCESDTRRHVLEILYTRCERVPMNEDFLRLKERIDHSHENDCMLLLQSAVEQGELPQDLDVSLAYGFLNTLMCGQCALLMDKDTSPGTFLRSIEPFLDAMLDAMRSSPSLRTGKVK